MVLLFQLFPLVPFLTLYASLYQAKIERRINVLWRKLFDYMDFMLYRCCRVASYAARALKMLILDDALRPQIATIVPPIICEAINYWEDEVCIPVTSSFCDCDEYEKNFM